MVKVGLTIDAGAARGIAEQMRPERLESVLIRALQRAMQPIVGQIKASAPIGKTSTKHHHLAGLLARSINLRVRTRRGLRVAIAGAPYGHLVEYGHRMVTGGKVTRQNRSTGARGRLTALPGGGFKGKRGGLYMGQVVGQVQAHPFVRPIIEPAVPGIQQTISDEVVRALTLAARIGKATGRGL